MGYGPQWGMMGGYGGYGFGILHMVFWLVLLIALVVAVIWLVRSMTASSAAPQPARRSRGLEVLEERYARGEVNREEYLQKKQDLLE